MLSAAVWLMLSSMLYSLSLGDAGSFPKPLTAAEERRYLEGLVEESVIGKYAISCVYVQLLEEGVRVSGRKLFCEDIKSIPRENPYSWGTSYPKGNDSFMTLLQSSTSENPFVARQQGLIDDFHCVSVFA